MKLYVSTTSPYARLAVIAAWRNHHQNIALEFVLPWQNPKTLTDVNPFSQVPALLCDDGNLLTESLIICQYLDNRFIQGGHDTALISYGMGIINQTVRGISIERNGEQAHPHPFIKRSYDILRTTLAKAETLNPSSTDWGHILLGSALNYVRMRTPDIYHACVSAENQVAITEFLKHDFMVKTEQSAFEKYPAYISDL